MNKNYTYNFNLCYLITFHNPVVLSFKRHPIKIQENLPSTPNPFLRLSCPNDSPLFFQRTHKMRDTNIFPSAFRKKKKKKEHTSKLPQTRKNYLKPWQGKGQEQHEGNIRLESDKSWWHSSIGTLGEEMTYWIERFSCPEAEACPPFSTNNVFSSVLFPHLWEK